MTTPITITGRIGQVELRFTSGGKAVLKQPLDLSRSLGVACGELKSRAVARTICEAAGKACTSSVSVQP